MYEHLIAAAQPATQAYAVSPATMRLAGIIIAVLVVLYLLSGVRSRGRND